MRRILRGPRKYIAVLLIIALIGPAARIGDDFFEISKNLEIFSDLYKNINLYYADDTKPGSLMKTGIDAMLNSLDPYTTYIPESRMEDYRFMTTGQYGGIGSLIRTIEGHVFISEPYQGFPAQKAGMIAGDRIIKVDGEDVEHKTQEEISEALKGSPGSKVKIEVLRDYKELTFEVEREEIKIPDVPYSAMLDDKTGYIKLNGFTRTASKEVREAYNQLKTEGMENVVLDLRGNGGGLLQEAVNIVNFFVPRGTEVVSTKGKIEEWDRVHKALNEPLSTEIPVAVLIDGGSASASEIVSGTLQDLDRAIIVGERSFGKGLVQQTKDIAYGSKLKITVAKYYTPSGRCIQKLDYFAKENGGRAEAVPDSLIKEFRTMNGRPVFDGKGINPDVEVEGEEMGKIIGGLFQGNYFFHYANEFAREHKEIDNADEFSLSDADYDAFVAWLSDKEVQYTTETQDALDKLIKKSKKEKYYEDSEEELEKLTKELAPHAAEDVIRFKDQIKYILESEIIARYSYQNGRIVHGLRDDPVIEAVLD
ncbi:MAG: S41 family peptidase, partial [Flavobacteriales bacterium]|nr:S41 family peptidase [Flavobacteriales bacterium]